MNKNKSKPEAKGIPFILYTSLTILIFFSSCVPAKRPAPLIEKFPEKGFDLIPRSEENFFSQKIAHDMEKNTEIVKNELLNKYIEELGGKIISQTPFRNFVEVYQWTFQIIDSSDVNAFATLGGKIYISRGMIEATESESELAGVLAFEMGHIMSRNVQQHVSQDAVIRGLVLPGEMIQGEKGLESLYQVIEAQGGAYNYFSRLEYYPEEVEKADKFALHNSYDAGFNPRVFINFLYRLLERKSQEALPLWIQRNPWSPRREEHLLGLLKLFPPIAFHEETSKFDDFKIQLKSLAPSPWEIEEKLTFPEYAAILTVNVLGDRGWTDTGLDVVEDQVIYFRASGGISLQQGNPLAYCGPDGYNLRTMQQPIVDKKIGALIGKVVKLISIEIDEETGEEIRNEIEKYFYIGSENRLRMEIDGRLFLGINENIVGDNSGEFDVTIHLEKPGEE